MPVLEAIKELKFHQDWAREHRADDGAAFTHFSSILVSAMVAEEDHGISTLASCSDAEFETAAQVFDDVAAVLGRSFLQAVERLALMRPGVDVRVDLEWARKAIKA